MIGDVPMAEEIYPLGGRDGETVGLELRGGSIAGVKFAALNLHAATGTNLLFPRINKRDVGLRPHRLPGL